MTLHYNNMRVFTLCPFLACVSSMLLAQSPSSIISGRLPAGEPRQRLEYIEVLKTAGQAALSAGDEPEVQFRALAAALTASKTPLPFGLVQEAISANKRSLLNDPVYQSNFVNITSEGTGRAWAPGGKALRADEDIYQACVAILREGDGVIGTGVLVEGELVLTAAHIFQPKSGVAPPDHVWIGSRFPKDFPDLDPGVDRGFKVRIDALMVHEEYGYRQGGGSCDGYKSPLRNDLLLLRIASADRAKVKAVAQFYPQPERFHQSIVNRDKKSVLAVGFGLNTVSQNGGTAPKWSNDRWKRQVSVALGSQDVKKYDMLHHTVIDGTLRYYEMIAAMPLSAGGLNEEANGNTCSGDSGGPVYTIENGTPYLVAIVSRAMECDQDCNEPGGIYTLVGPYISWIRGARESNKWLAFSSE